MKLEKVCEKTVDGAVYSISSLNGKFVATIANQVKIFELTKNSDLQSESPYSGNIVALYSDVSDNGFILVGDLMRSISGNCFVWLTTCCHLIFKKCQVNSKYYNNLIQSSPGLQAARGHFGGGVPRLQPELDDGGENDR